MVFNPGEGVLGSRAKFFRDARTWAISLVTSLIGIRYFIEIIKNTYAFFNNVFNLFFLALFCLTMALIFLWIWATSNEIDILIKWLHPSAYQPPRTIVELIMILSEALLLVALAYASRNPFYYGILFSAYSLVVLILEIYLKRQLKELFSKNTANLSKEMNLKPNSVELGIYKGVAGVLEKHYLERPTTLRHSLILGFCLVGFAFSVIWLLEKTPLFGILAYITFFLTILISEIVLNYWRYRRDTSIRELEANLTEIQEG